jgi:hypothetical protein
MAIKFICTCGKHMRARDEMAGRRSKCPRCGSPVGIPSLQPTHTGTAAAPLTPLERQRLASQRLPAAAGESGTAIGPLRPGVPADHAATISRVQQVLASDRTEPEAWPRSDKQRPGKTWKFESNWYECLLYPLRAWLLVVCLTVVLTLLTGAGAFLLPNVLMLYHSDPEQGLALATYFLLPVVAFAYTGTFFECAMSSAAAGEARHLHWPGANLSLVLGCGLTWLACFLAGPVIFATVGVRYWVLAGDVQTVDILIIGEFFLAAIFYWLCALMAVNERDRLRDVQPLRVARLAHRLGPLRQMVLLVASATILVIGWCAWAAMELVQEEPTSGCLVLLACWYGGLFLGTFLFRLLGVWCHQLGLLAT